MQQETPEDIVVVAEDMQRYTKGKTKYKQWNTTGAQLEANKSQEDPSQESSYSVQNYTQTRANEADPVQEKRLRLQLTPSTDSRWQVLDDNFDSILNSGLKGDACTKIRLLSNMVYEECKNTFGI